MATPASQCAAPASACGGADERVAPASTQDSVDDRTSVQPASARGVADKRAWQLRQASARLRQVLDRGGADEQAWWLRLVHATPVSIHDKHLWSYGRPHVGRNHWFPHNGEMVVPCCLGARVEVVSS